MRRLRVLVVDDSRAHLAAAVEQLSADHEVTTTDSYEEALEKIRAETYDAVLSDLMMPAEPHALGTEGLKHLGHPVAIGFVVALCAARAGVQMVAVITDANHHNHPMSAALDFLGPANWHHGGTPPFQVNGARVIVAHAPLLLDGRKDWKTALAALAD
jgi:CheY-like chemotaxis protein